MLLRRIRQCLYDQGYTIKGVQKLLREGALRSDAPPPRPPAPTPAARPNDGAGSATATGRAALVELRRELAELRDLLKKRGR